MGRFISPGVFAAIFTVAYTALAIVDWTPFLYYPQVNAFSTIPLDRKSGPSMHWYGWIVTAIVIAVILSASIPTRWTKQYERELSWIPAILAIFAILIFERRWLF